MRTAWNFPTLKEITEECRGSAALQGAQNYELWSVPSFSAGHPEIVKGSSILSAKRPVQAGDVLLCKINPRINRVWVVGDNEALPKVASTEWIVLRPKSRQLVSPRWLQLYLSSSAFRSWIVGEISGATGSHTRAKPREVMCQRIPLPPLPEQKRIVAILDEAFAGIATAVANTEKNLANARELFESYLNVVFGKRGEGWVNKKLGEVCDGKITDGTHQTPKYYDDGFIFLSSRNVKSGEIDWQNIKYVDRSQHEAMQKRVSPRPGDILLAKNGTTGVAAIVDRDVSFDIYVSLALLRPSTHMDSRYLWHFINSPIAKKQFNKRLKGVGVPNLHLKEIREVELSFPLAKSEQVRVVERLDEVLEEKQKLASIYQQKLNALDELKQSLLQKAFSGELTTAPQDEIETALA